MKNRGHKRLLRLFAGLLPLLMMASCLDEVGVNVNPDPNSESMVTFSLQVPGSSSPSSRALEETDENSVTEIDILGFDKNRGEYVYKASCNNITGTSKIKSFTIKLRQGEYDLVIFANARSIINSVQLEGKTKTNALALLTTTMPSGGKWIANTGTSGYKPFPMWGDVGIVTVSSQANAEQNATLTRMTARVDVQVSANNFILTSVDVYNYKTKGTLVPKNAGKPNVPQSSNLIGPITYEETEINTEENQCTNEIYIFESDNHTEDDDVKDLTDRTCLVVGGKWKDDDKPTYYRMDFAIMENNTQVYLDVLRNHKYIFNITKVSGPGHDDSETAFKSVPTNIEAEVLEWNEVDGGDIIFDGQNYLSISPEMLFEFMRDADTKNVKVKTNVSEGFQIIKITEKNNGTEIDNTGWLTINKNLNTYYGTGETSETIEISVSQNSGSDREGYIYIKAGRLEAKLIIKQSNISPLSVKIVAGPDDLTEIKELVFLGKAPIESQSFTVNWEPKIANLTVTSETIGGYAFPTSSSSPQAGVISGGNGTKTYTFAPSAYTSEDINNEANPFIEKVSKITFTTTNGSDKASASIYLRQKNYNLVTDVESEYVLSDDNQRKYIHVRANFDWKIKEVDDPYGVLVEGGNNLLAQTGGNNTSQGDALTLLLAKDNGSNTGKTATIIIQSRVDDSEWPIIIRTQSIPPRYVGYFGGKLMKNLDGEWQFEKKLYMENMDAADQAKWGINTDRMNVFDAITGKANTLFLWKTSQTNFPAVSLCMQKNEDSQGIEDITDSNYNWYLPAQKQLMAIWAVHTSFESKFKLSTDVNGYWSATESANTAAFSVSFNNGSIEGFGKAKEKRVRCVRE